MYSPATPVNPHFLLHGSVFLLSHSPPTVGQELSDCLGRERCISQPLQPQLSGQRGHLSISLPNQLQVILTRTTESHERERECERRSEKAVLCVCVQYKLCGSFLSCPAPGRVGTTAVQFPSSFLTHSCTVSQPTANGMVYLQSCWCSVCCVCLCS